MDNRFQFTATDLGGGVWEINQSNENIDRYVDAYLVCGSKKAALIDTGLYEGGLLDVVRSLTSLPVEVIISHGHGDHAGLEVKNLAQAGLSIYMDPKDNETLFGAKRSFDAGVFSPLHDGQLFDLGGRTLEVIPVAGHTHGSIVLLDRENQLMFTGDAIGAGIIWVQLSCSVPLDQFLEELKRLEKVVAPYDNLRIYPGHLYQTTGPLGKHYVTEMREITQDLVSGRVTGVPIDEEFTAKRFPDSLQASHGMMYRYCYNPNSIHSK